MFLDIRPADERLPDKEWHKHIEGFIIHKKLNPEIIEFLDSYQTYCIKEIHKTFNRIKNRKHARQTHQDSEGAEGTEGTVE